MRTCRLACSVIAGSTLALHAGSALAQQNLHFTYMWHMEQPIYWPDRQITNAGLGDQYERLAESLARGGTNPLNALFDIFNKDDRVAAYQGRPRDSISAFAAFPSFGSVPEGGAQVSFSGGLIQNIQSVAGTGFIGGRYGSNWFDGYRQARSWQTTGGTAVPRCDMVLFPFHHALMPLVAESTMRKQIQTYKAIYNDAWGTGAPMSVGFFPSEMAFSTRMIGALADEGVQWSIVSGEKISRACANWPVVFGSGGTPCDPPNRADQINPAQADYFRVSIDRGCSPAEAYPYGFTPRRARYVDPNTGQVKSIIVVPSSQSLSWRDGYSAQGIAEFNTLNARNDPNRPMLVVLSHDGDNDWGGGASYYLEATPNRVRDARNAGYVPTVIQRYLADHPVPANDFVHVEDGAWVNADGDFGSPQFWNWNWPLLNASGQPDPVNGWHVDARNWAVITAMQNRVDTIEQMHLNAGGTVNPRRIVYPHEGANNVERAWHYFMGSLNSGYMYYGSAIDMEVKQSVACNNAARFTDPIISAAPATGPTSDLTGPTIWVPQRWPYNPGGQGFGNPYRQGNNYGPFVQPVDFTVWTFVADASSTQSVTLKYRVDLDGQRSLSNTENETYAGGPGVGPWISVPMNGRAFPAGNVYNDGEINFFVTPTHIAEHYSAQITGQANKLLGYYVEAVDSKGNISRSPIQHVWVGDGVGAGGNPNPTTVVTASPNPPTAGQSVTITYDPTGRNLASATSVNMYWGVNTWTGIQTTAMTRANASLPWSVSVTLPSNATVMDIVFNNGAGTWDNNGGADWHFAVQAGTPVTGRCCVAGACSVVLQSACTGTFTPGGDCAIACPPVAMGACCSPLGACSTTTQAACTGTWTSGGSCSPSPCPFVMDGQVDAGAIAVATNGGRSLHAALRGDVLYIAGPMGADTDDRFIYLAAPPGAMSAANWAKQGQIAGFSCFLASEGSGSYFGWQQQTAGATITQARGSASGVLEGTINLRQELALGTGPLPADIYLAFGQYTTPDNGTLLASMQIPAGNGNGNIEAAEFLRVRICSLLATGCCPADFDGINGVDVQDIFSFLNAWFAGDPRADFDQVNSVDVQDIFSFLNAWFSGCA